MRNSVAETAKEMIPSAPTVNEGVAVAAFFRRRYPRHTEKLIADEWNVAPQTARGWLSGRLPASRYLVRMMRRYGRRFVAELTDLPELNVEAELEEIRRRTDQLEAECRRLWPEGP